MSELDDDITTLETTLNELRRLVKVEPSGVADRVLKAARRVANGISKAAIELVDSDGNHQWVVTVLVDGPGDYILLTPKDAALGVTTVTNE